MHKVKIGGRVAIIGGTFHGENGIVKTKLMAGARPVYEVKVTTGKYAHVAGTTVIDETDLRPESDDDAESWPGADDDIREADKFQARKDAKRGDRVVRTKQVQFHVSHSAPSDNWPQGAWSLYRITGDDLAKRIHFDANGEVVSRDPWPGYIATYATVEGLADAMKQEAERG